MGFTRRGSVRTPVLEIAYEEAGPTDGPVGGAVARIPLRRAGVRRGRRRARRIRRARHRAVPARLRSDAVHGCLDDALGRAGRARAGPARPPRRPRHSTAPIVGGYDWGGRAACIVAALHPSRVRGLVTVGGYNVFDPAFAPEPTRPEWERTYWYKYYFHSKRGRRGLERYRARAVRAALDDAGRPSGRCRRRPSRRAPEPRQPRLRRRGHPLVPAPRTGSSPAIRATPPSRRRSPPSRRSRVPTVVLESGADGIGGPSGAHDRDRFTGAVRVPRAAGHRPRPAAGGAARVRRGGAEPASPDRRRRGGSTRARPAPTSRGERMPDR